MQYLGDYIRAVLQGTGGAVVTVINVITLVFGLAAIALIAYFFKLDAPSLALSFVGFLVLLVVTHYGSFKAYQHGRKALAKLQAGPRPVFKFTRAWVDERAIESPGTGFSRRTIEAMPVNYAPEMSSLPELVFPNITGTHSVELPEPEGERYAYFAHAEMCNDPPIEWRTPEADATSVVSIIRFFRSEDDSLLFEMDGRWGCCAKQPARQSPLDSVEFMRRIDVPANGERHFIDIAIKHPEDADCYAFSSTSFFAPRGCRPEWKLIGSRFRVEVTLKGHRTDEKVDYWLTNLGKGRGLTIERLGSDTKGSARQ